jgi:hypothetical protein
MAFAPTAGAKGGEFEFAPIVQAMKNPATRATPATAITGTEESAKRGAATDVPPAKATTDTALASGVLPYYRNQCR